MFKAAWMLGAGGEYDLCLWWNRLGDMGMSECFQTTTISNGGTFGKPFIT